MSDKIKPWRWVVECQQKKPPVCVVMLLGAGRGFTPALTLEQATAVAAALRQLHARGRP